jgi:hypothetical protein
MQDQLFSGNAILQSLSSIVHPNPHLHADTTCMTPPPHLQNISGNGSGSLNSSLISSSLPQPLLSKPLIQQQSQPTSLPGATIIGSPIYSSSMDATPAMSGSPDPQLALDLASGMTSALTATSPSNSTVPPLISAHSHLLEENNGISNITSIHGSSISISSIPSGSATSGPPLYTDTPIDDLVGEISKSTNRPEKASEWIAKLRSQDIKTVGDLCELHEEDWPNLNLTVFASRALRNAIMTRPILKPLSKPSNTPTQIIQPSPTGKTTIVGSNEHHRSVSPGPISTSTSPIHVSTDREKDSGISGYKISISPTVESASTEQPSFISNIHASHPQKIYRDNYDPELGGSINQVEDITNPNPTHVPSGNPSDEHQTVTSDVNSTLNSITRSASPPANASHSLLHQDYSNTTSYE